MSAFWINLTALGMAGAAGWLVVSRVMAVMGQRNSRWTGFPKQRPGRDHRKP